jgi:hypothetical protein
MAAFRQLLSALPFRFHWVLVLLMALVIPVLTAKTPKPGEFYPFSNFPMYSSFEPSTYLVYITDWRDQPIAISPTFSTSASDIKKTYDLKLGLLKSKAPKGSRKASLPLELRKEAADATLRELIQRVSPKSKLDGFGGLRLHQVDIRYNGETLSTQTTQVGEVPLP